MNKYDIMFWDVMYPLGLVASITLIFTLNVWFGLILTSLNIYGNYNYFTEGRKR